MWKQIKEFLTNERDLMITFFLGSVCYFLLALSLIMTIRKQNLEIDLLTKEKTDLEVEIANKDNEIYELNLELASTEKTLADTAYELDLLSKKDIEDLQLRYVGEYKCTAYCCEKYPHICGTGSGKTASGVPITQDVTVAVNDTTQFPFGTILYIEDVGIRIVQDTGPFSGKQIDCAVDTHEHALHWEGSGKHKVWIVEKGNEDE